MSFSEKGPGFGDLEFRVWPQTLCGMAGSYLERRVNPMPSRT